MSERARHVLVTGGGSGVGAATAQAFASAGFQVTLVGRDRDKLAAQGLPYQQADVTDRDALFEAFAAARRERGPIDIAVANAGAAHSRPFTSLTPDHLEQMLAVNLHGVVYTWQAALEDMKASGWGRLIAIASTAGLKGYGYVSAYCAAKHGVVGLTKSLALELAASGVTANAICPGFVDTPLLHQSIDNIVDKTGMSRERAEASLRDTNPQRRFVQADEVASAALWLASDAAASVNGHSLALSGGEV